MDPSLLLKPSKKKRCRDYIERKAAFPLWVDKNTRSTSQGAGTSGKRQCHIGTLESNCVLVADKKSIKILWTMGFFGKGTISKRTPAVCMDLVNQKLPSDSESNLELMNISSESSSDDERDWKRKVPSASESAAAAKEGAVNRIDVAAEEKLQLTFEEAFFLSYGLGILVVMDKEQYLDLMRLWNRFCDLTPDNKFPVMYTAYHHFRSKGWIVRSGIKYGTDYVLYKDGPLYYHSTYAVVVKPVKEKNLKDINKDDRLPLTWLSLAAANRVVTHVAKGLMYLYVIRPEMMSENKISTPFCVSQFKLQEVLIKRWVPAAGREDD